MTVYYDLIFLVNLIYQFGILIFTNRILKHDRSAVKILTGALIQCFLFVVIIILTFPTRQTAGWILNIAGSFLVSAVLFRADTVKKLWRLFMTESVLCILLGGILTLIRTYTKQDFLLVTAAGSLIFLGFFIESLRELFAHALGRKNCFYKVRLTYRERQVDTKGLLDSGNSLTDPFSKEPVCIITKDLCGRLLNGENVEKQNGYRLIPYHAVGKKNGIMEAFFVDAMELRQDTKEDPPFFFRKILCAVSPNMFSGHADYEMILHPKLFM